MGVSKFRQLKRLPYIFWLVRKLKLANGGVECRGQEAKVVDAGGRSVGVLEGRCSVGQAFTKRVG